MENNNLVKNPGGRIPWIEYIRVFSTFLVVMQHSISGVWTTMPPETPEWKEINFVFLISRCAVPVFFMCSGIGMLAKERTIESIFKKNICGLFKIYIPCMLVFGVRDAITLIREGYGIKVILNAFIKEIIFGQYHTWFILTLMGLYLITPLLYEIAKRETLMKYFLMLSVVFTVILPAIGKLDGSNRLNGSFESINMRFVTGWVMYYGLGYYLYQVKWAKKRKKDFVFMVLLFAGSVLAAFVISSTMSARNGVATQTVYGEFAPLGLIINVSFLMLFRILITSGESKRWISIIGSYGADIYLMHPLLLPIASRFSGISRILGGIIVYLVTLIICIGIGKVGRIFRRKE